MTVDRLTTFEAGGLRYIAEDRCAISADEDSGHRAGEERNEAKYAQLTDFRTGLCVATGLSTWNVRKHWARYSREGLTLYAKRFPSFSYVRSPSHFAPGNKVYPLIWSECLDCLFMA